MLAREPWKITLFDIVSCIEGLDVQSTKPEHTLKSAEGAVVWEAWQEARQAADAVLQKYTLQTLAEKRDARQRLDIMYYI